MSSLAVAPVMISGIGGQQVLSMPEKEEILFIHTDQLSSDDSLSSSVVENLESADHVAGVL